jgi:hypothetical protein
VIEKAEEEAKNVDLNLATDKASLADQVRGHVREMIEASLHRAKAGTA